MSADLLTHRPPTAIRSPLLYFVSAVAAGIVVDRLLGERLLGQGVFCWWFGSVVFLLCGICLRYRSFKQRSMVLLLATLCLGGGWHHLRWHYFEQDNLALFANQTAQPVCVQAIALERPQSIPTPPRNPLRALPASPHSDVELRITHVRDGTRWFPASGTCGLRVDGDLEQVNAGDRLLVFAQLRRVSPAMNPGQFDWAEAERGAGRLCQLVCRAPECVTITSVASSLPFSRWLNGIGKHCEARLSSYVDAEQGDLAQALMLGARERLDSNLVDAFRETGTIHLLVVSGLHVGFLAVIVWMILTSGFLSRRTGLLLTTLMVLVYALVTGGRPPVVRATVLVLLTFTSYVVGRRVSFKNLLAGAALVVLAINPSELFRSGTQLSFLCVAVLGASGKVIFGASMLDPLARLIRDREPWYQKTLRWAFTKFKQTATASLVIWIAVAPLVAYHFHISAPISILITPLLWPMVAVALISGLAICTVAWIFPPLAMLLGNLCSLSLWSIESLVETARTVEIGNFYLPGPPLWWVLCFYVGLATAVLFVKTHMPVTRQLAMVAIWVAVGLVVARVEKPHEKLRCTFLSVGHGTCVVLEMPGGETLLYDAGSLGSPDWAADTIASYLWSRGITNLDAVVLSHADVDHYNALPGLMERFHVRSVYVSPLMFDPWITDGQLDAPEYLRQVVEEAGIPLHKIWVNDRLRTASGEVTLEVLHPPRRGVAGRDNANSLLLAVQYAGQSILLPGDLEAAGIEAVIAEEPRHFDILLAPHHGSSRSDPPGFAAWCTPKWVIVSGRPADSSEQQLTVESYRQVGADVLHTADLGAITFDLSKSGTKYTAFCGQKL